MVNSLRPRLTRILEFAHTSRVKWALIGIAAGLQAVGVTLWCVEKSEPGSIFVLLASLVIVLIALLSKSLKETILNLLLAVAPTPVFMGLLLSAVLALGVFNNGIAETMSLQNLSMLVSVPIVFGLLFLSILWPQLLTAMALRLSWNIGRKTLFRK